MQKTKIIKAFLWTFLYLIVIDFGVNTILSYPENPRNTDPSFLQQYFEQGRSIEGKLERITRQTDADSAPIVSLGWLAGDQYESMPSKAGKNQVLITVYGMSHANLLGQDIAAADRSFVVREITAPGAPPNWAYAAYLADRKRVHSDVVILGIMTDSVALLSSTTGQTAYFDMSYPYTFPRFEVKSGHLRPLYPPFLNSKQFREYFYSPGRWEEYRAWLSKNDNYYDPLLFRKSWADRSCLVRLLRRAYSEKIRQERIANVYSKRGFNPDSEEMRSLYAIVKDFVLSARREHSLPVIYIVNNQGRGDHLYRALKPLLDSYEIPYLSTHTICPPDDPRSFLAENQHFPPAKDAELAREVIKIINKELNRSCTVTAHARG